MRRDGKGALRKMLQFMQFSCSIIRFSEPQNFHCGISHLTFPAWELPISVSSSAAVIQN